MFKSIISKFQDFGKAVVSRIVGFVGGIFGVKPETVEVPAPPEISDVQANNSPEVSEPKGLIKKTFQTVKKALLVSAQIAYMIAHFAVPFQMLSLAWEYAQAQGLVAIFIGLWNMGTLPYFILCIAILLGVGAALITIETLWSALLYPVRRFLFPVKQAQQPVTVTVEPIQSEEDEEDALYIISTVEKIIKQTEDRLDERLVAIETMLNAQAIATPTINKEEVKTVVDSSPAVVITTSAPEVVPVVIEIEETVDSSPSPVPPTDISHPLSMLFVLDEATLTQELTELNMEAIKKMITALNSHLKAPQKVSSHPPKNTPKGEGKNVLINRIKRQVKDIRANNQMVAA
jgi:hypothetical protein